MISKRKGCTVRLVTLPSKIYIRDRALLPSGSTHNIYRGGKPVISKSDLQKIIPRQFHFPVLSKKNFLTFLFVFSCLGDVSFNSFNLYVCSTRGNIFQKKIIFQIIIYYPEKKIILQKQNSTKENYFSN